MDRPIELQLEDTWRALSGTGDEEGWRTIEIGGASSCRVRAGRHFPGNEESLLAGFLVPRPPSIAQLPQAQGFAVSVAELGRDTGPHVWVALRRDSAGSRELFLAMAADVAGYIKRATAESDEQRLTGFIARIRSWQDFMRKGTGALSAEAEVGLIGELVILRAFVSGGVPASVVLDAWQGPDDGLHDFVFGSGAIEVKATAAAVAFPVLIGSLDQLDDSVVKPLFLAGVRLAQHSAGDDLPGHVTHCREVVSSVPFAAETLDRLLVKAGYADAHGPHYTRRFSVVSINVFLVDEAFPRLTSANVLAGVVGARYEIDLGLVHERSIDLPEALTLLGVAA